MEGKGRRKLGSGLKAGAQLSGWQRGTRFSPNLKRGNCAETANPTSVPLGILARRRHGRISRVGQKGRKDFRVIK